MRGGAAVVLAGAAVIPLSSGAASASCAEVPVEQWATSAGRLLVGRAVEETNGFTRVAVREVWSGPDLAPQVWFDTGEQHTEVLTRVGSGDYGLEVGTDYLISYDDDYRTSICSARPVDDDVTSSRPQEVRQPVEGAATGARPTRDPRSTILISGAVTLAGATLVTSGRRRLVRRRQRRSR